MTDKSTEQYMDTLTSWIDDPYRKELAAKYLRWIYEDGYDAGRAHGYDKLTQQTREREND